MLVVNGVELFPFDQPLQVRKLRAPTFSASIALYTCYKIIDVRHVSQHYIIAQQQTGFFHTERTGAEAGDYAVKPMPVRIARPIDD